MPQQTPEARQHQTPTRGARDHAEHARGKEGAKSHGGPRAAPRHHCTNRTVPASMGEYPRQSTRASRDRRQRGVDRPGQPRAASAHWTGGGSPGDHARPCHAHLPPIQHAASRRLYYLFHRGVRVIPGGVAGRSRHIATLPALTMI